MRKYYFLLCFSFILQVVNSQDMAIIENYQLQPDSFDQTSSFSGKEFPFLENEKQEKKSLGHKRVFTGVGILLIASPATPTDIKFSTYSVIGTFDGTEEGKVKGSTIYSFNLQWLNIFISRKLGIDLSSQFGFFEQKPAGLENINLKAKMNMMSSSLILKAYLSNKITEAGDYVYTFFGIGPTYLKYNNLSASASDDGGNTKSVKMTFDPLYGVTPKVGIDIVSKSVLGSIGLGVYVPFSKVKISSLVEKENGSIITSNPAGVKTIYPINCMLTMNLCFGY